MLFFLDPLGEVRPCNVLERSLGNLKHQSFAEIWHSPEAEAIRAEVIHCSRNCWMIGSVAEPMKQHLGLVLHWIIRRKIKAATR